MTNTHRIFKEITVGGLSQKELTQKLTSAGVQFNKYAEMLFTHPKFNPPSEIQNVILAKVSLSDLGFANPSSYHEFVRRASEQGLELCPIYLAAFLRLEYLDQPEGGYLTIASRKLETDEEYPNGLYVRKLDNVLWLRGYRADDFCEWPEHNEFIFIRK